MRNKKSEFLKRLYTNSKTVAIRAKHSLGEAAALSFPAISKGVKSGDYYTCTEGTKDHPVTYTYFTGEEGKPVQGYKGNRLVYNALLKVWQVYDQAISENTGTSEEGDEIIVGSTTGVTVYDTSSGEIILDKSNKPTSEFAVFASVMPKTTEGTQIILKTNLNG